MKRFFDAKLAVGRVLITTLTLCLTIFNKICETDIEPSALAINPKVQNKINVGEAAGFTIPIERPKNKENRYKLIDKKREMFLVQQMLETKQREI